MFHPSIYVEYIHPGKNRAVRSSAPATKSYWSSPGAFCPLSIPSLRFMNAPHRSPRTAPNESVHTMPAHCQNGPYPQWSTGSNIWDIPIRIRPKAIPENAPPKKPLQDFPSPNILLPLQDFPKSIFAPPPNTTAAEFGSMAGRNTQSPTSINPTAPRTSIISSVLDRSPSFNLCLSHE